ncbi:siphovirus ReqiPepy6 Gp37-like family protein [Caproicibacter sp. BJN0012]|uniref:siphovirus ReqiPepy6 Gp37-like family protein n=1 Tax=Caproicibacter sp. BJN0012 TaxID=3110227 RepID=UPI002E1624E9
MELYIYSPEIELQGVVDGFSSFRWRRRFFEPGEFELHCAATPNNRALLAGENIIHRLDRSEAGIIESVKIDAPDGGTGDEIVAAGRMGSSMLDRRIIMPAINYTGAAESAMRKIVSDNAISIRPLPHLALGAAAGLTPACAFQVEWKTVLTVCEALGKAAPLGFRVRLDVPNKLWVFEAYGGTDHSVTQAVNPIVLFSDEFQNISGAAYTLDHTGYSNYAIVGGEGGGADRVITEVDRTGGEPRRELWVDANDLKSSADTEDCFTGDGSAAAFALSHTPSNVGSVTVGSTSASDYALDGSMITFPTALASGAAVAVSYSYCLTPGEYAALLTQRGVEKLAGAVKAESFSADAVDTGNFAYLTDWDLGDIVSFEKWGILLNQRITEVEEVYENGVETITPVCGTPLPETLNLGDDR